MIGRRGLGPAGVGAAAGAVWGLAGYLVLWGHTPLVVHRPFVLSALGTVLLLPVRLVLWGIRVVEERVVGHPFDFSRSSEWIGLLAAAVGAGVAVAGVVAVRLTLRRVRTAAAPR
ncbi:MAG TPA: hypothetical protein VHL78_08040 [Actinomycetota bacterium]|nr:hypothetical protein [Actinomycetota bacterium]